ncbi:MAG: type IV secretion system protein VirB9 [Rickettsiales bacterium]|jgi:type IV secretion system protein VirB9
MGLKTKIITNFLIFIIILAPSNLVAQTSFKTAPKIISSPRIIPITTDSRIKTLVYNANEVFQLKFHYGYQSFIEFSDDEETEMISIGESFAWRLTPAGKRLFIRPLEIGAHTNMTIITNKRTYQFDIESAEYDGRADEELVYTVRFYYPEVGVRVPIPPKLSRPNVRPKPAIAIVKRPSRLKYSDDYESQKDPDDSLNFLYSIAGRSTNITPLKIYDDGKETFFQFKDKNLIVPTISTVDLFGNEQPVAYLIREDFVVVEGIYPQLTLRLADSLLCVFNEKIVSRPATARNNLYQ